MILFTRAISLVHRDVKVVLEFFSVLYEKENSGDFNLYFCNIKKKSRAIVGLKIIISLILPADAANLTANLRNADLNIHRMYIWREKVARKSGWKSERRDDSEEVRAALVHIYPQFHFALIQTTQFHENSLCPISDRNNRAQFFASIRTGRPVPSMRPDFAGKRVHSATINWF